MLNFDRDFMIGVVSRVVAALAVATVIGIVTWLRRNGLNAARRLRIWPRFTRGAAAGEFLLIVTRFSKESETRNLDVRTVLAEGVQRQVPRDLRLRVEIAEQLTLRCREEALALAKRYKAILVVWGRYTDNLVEVNPASPLELSLGAESSLRYFVGRPATDIALVVNDLAERDIRWLGLLTLAEALSLSGRSKDSIQCLDAALGMLDESGSDLQRIADTLFHRGRARMAQGDASGAVADFTRCVDIAPRWPDAYNNRGASYARLKDYESASRDFDKAIECNPEMAVAFYNRAGAHEKLGRHDSARQDCERALELYGNDADAHNFIGYLHTQKGEYSEAVEEFRLALRVNRNHSLAYYNRGLAHAKLLRFRRAIRDFGQVLRLSPESAEAHSSRACAYAELGKYGRAMEDLRHAIKLDPRYAPAFYNTACVHALVGAAPEACLWLERAIELDETCREDARSERDFRGVREEPCFAAIVGEAE